jgi:nitroreductase
MEVIQAIAQKRAVREFSGQPIPDHVCRQILNAGRRAQSAKNRQLWHFIATRERAILETLSRLGTYAAHLAGAALGVVIVTPDPAIRWSIMFDAGQAAAYMQLAAWDLGIGSCLATIHEEQAARTLLEIPPEMRVHVAISFGYPQEAAVLSAPPRSGGRKTYNDVVHHDRWNPDVESSPGASLHF